MALFSCAPTQKKPAQNGNDCRNVSCRFRSARLAHLELRVLRVKIDIAASDVQIETSSI